MNYRFTVLKMYLAILHWQLPRLDLLASNPLAVWKWGIGYRSDEARRFLFLDRSGRAQEACVTPACAHTAVYMYTVCAWEPNHCVVAFWAGVVLHVRRNFVRWLYDTGESPLN
jgi:hypothetical protein